MARLVIKGRGVVEVSGGGRAGDLVKRGGLALSEVLILKGGEVVTEDEPVGEDEEITVYIVKSGG
ncbi:MAG: thiamine biosynthesis protein ThiS [Desulfurococcaceae archaeon]